MNRVTSYTDHKNLTSILQNKSKGERPHKDRLLRWAFRIDTYLEKKTCLLILCLDGVTRSLKKQSYTRLVIFLQLS